MDWIAFDEFEPIGSRTVPELLALLTSITVNMWQAKGKRPLLPQDILADPLAPTRLSEVEEAARKGEVMADYRRLRAERLARMAESQGSTN